MDATEPTNGDLHATPAHPLDCITVDEIRIARDVLRAERSLGYDSIFCFIRLQEPSKEELTAFAPGQPIERRVFLSVMNRHSGTLAEAIVSVTRREVVSFEWREGLQGPLTMDDMLAAESLIRSDSRWQTAVRRRGIDDLAAVKIDAWGIGSFAPAEEQSRRMVASLSYLREHPDDNPWARPIEGLIAYVDLNRDEVTRVVDAPSPAPVPTDPGRYDAKYVGTFREGLRPLEVAQPDGPSFEVHGNEISWQRWRFRFSFNTREGLVLHTLAYEDAGELRPVIHRASVSEMIVPYGDVSPSHFFQNAFDLGEFGIGKGVNSLELGCDCLGEIRYFDVILHSDAGEPVVVQNGVCLHEEDYGVLWKHWDFPDGGAEVRRSRRLVISSISTNLNYEYGYYWYLYLDGTIEFEVKLTGILQTAAVSDGGKTPHAKLVAPHLSAPHHQHMFNVRLDMEVDGPSNTVTEIDLVAAPQGPDNPYGSAMVTRETPLCSEQEARRNIDAAAGRTWIISNPSRPNRLGQPSAYRLVPMYTPVLLAPESSAVGRRATFAQYNLWVTPYDPEERHAGGEYPNQHPGGAGLPEWTARDRPIANTDIVLWHTFGVSHVARPEDWPVMPAEYAGFKLKPWGFFDHNPALDVPPSEHRHGH